MSEDPLPELPADWRSLSTDDLHPLLRLEQASDAADRERFPTTLDELASFLGSPTIELERMSVTIEDATGQLIAWCCLEPRIGGATWNRIHIHGSVHPAARGRGHGRALLGWAEARSAAVIRVAADGRRDLPDVLTVHAAETATDRAGLQDRCGYQIARWYSDMFRSLGAPLAPAPLAAGYSFVDWTRPRDADFHATDVEAFRDQWGSAPWSAEAWRHEFADDEGFRPDLTVGVEHQGQVVGYVMAAAYGGIEDEEGRRVAWLARLGVRRQHRGRGIATAAITRVLSLAREAGFATAGLDVDTENLTGALRLYERLGFYPVKRLALRTKTIRAAERR
ncbi:MAG: GNAT family N-acetyltransferase [Candidatus Limnocylindrales bacterium]